MSKKTEEFLRRARARFDRSAEHEEDNREWGRDDLNFVAGDQWPEEIETARNDKQQPCLAERAKAFGAVHCFAA